MQLLSTFCALCCELGIPLAEAKADGPSTMLSFLGIELDTVQQCSRLPAKKAGMQAKNSLSGICRFWWVT